MYIYIHIEFLRLYFESKKQVKIILTKFRNLNPKTYFLKLVFKNCLDILTSLIELNPYSLGF